MKFIKTIELFSTVMNPKTSYKLHWHRNTSVSHMIFSKTVVGGPRVLFFSFFLTHTQK